MLQGPEIAYKARRRTPYTLTYIFPLIHSHRHSYPSAGHRQRRPPLTLSNTLLASSVPIPANLAALARAAYRDQVNASAARRLRRLRPRVLSYACAVCFGLSLVKKRPQANASSPLPLLVSGWPSRAVYDTTPL